MTLASLKICGNGSQHVLGVISQGQRVHPLCGRGQRPGKVFPLLKDWLHVLFDEISQTHCVFPFMKVDSLSDQPDE
jgi:hypothetical protein